MKFVENLIQLGQQLERENEAAYDLWSWLPSHKVAKRHHGDYATEFRPSNRDVMVEAAMHFARLADPDQPLTVDEREWFERCPCGEGHVP